MTSVSDKPAPDTTPVAAQQPQADLRKLGIDLAPLLVFLTAYYAAGIYWATGLLMVSIVAAVIASRAILGHVSPTMLVTAALVLVFGGLTLALQDVRFIKMKPTLVNLVLAGALSIGLWLKKPILQLVIGNAFQLTNAGWRGLTFRWIFFFLFLAGLNEAVWRLMSEQAWVRFKVLGILFLTMIFAVSMTPYIKRHTLPPQ